MNPVRNSLNNFYGEKLNTMINKSKISNGVKLLAIHSNKLLLEPQNPNAYKFLAEKRNRARRFEALDKKYEAKKEKGSLLLQKTFDLAAKGLTREEFVNNCHDYWKNFLNKEAENSLREARKDFDLIYIFTSYPKAVYLDLIEKGLVDNVFGPEFKEKKGMIKGIKEIELKNMQEVRNKLAEIGLENKFTLEPNRYGLLELLIDEMISKGIDKKDVVVIGKDLTAQPLHKVSSRQVESFSEI